MLLKLAAYATLGYVGYKYLQHSQGEAAKAGTAPAPLAVAGGPLSAGASLQHSSDPAEWSTSSGPSDDRAG